MRRTWIIAFLLILILLGGFFVRDLSLKPGTGNSLDGERSETPLFPDPAGDGLTELDESTSQSDASSDPSSLTDLAAPAAPASPAAPPDPLSSADSWPDPQDPGTRFEVFFGEYRPPLLGTRIRWEIASFREMLDGCRAVRSSPLGGPFPVLVYRTSTLPTVADEQSEAYEVIRSAPVSVAVFLVAVPFDGDDHLIPGIVETYCGELRTTVGELIATPRVNLFRSSSAATFTVAFPVSGAVDAQGSAPEYSGNFGHAGAFGRYPAADLAAEFDPLFPVELEPFLDDSEYLRFTDVPFTLTADAQGEIRFSNWPDCMTLPSRMRVRVRGEFIETLEFSEPESLLVRFGGSDRRVVPAHQRRLEYAPGPQTGMPPIEVRGVEFEDGVVLVDEPGLSATATYSSRLDQWLWDVRTLGSIRDSTPFTAWLLGTGIEPALARGKYGSPLALRFIASPARSAQRLQGEILVDPALRLPVPLIGQLTVTLNERSISQEIRLTTRQGRYSLHIAQRLAPATLEVAVDAALWAEQLRAKYRARRGIDLEPIWIVAELLAVEGNRRWYEVTVHSELESWSIGEFYDRFDL